MKACGQWSRPVFSVIVFWTNWPTAGVRPNSPVTTTSVVSSSPRSSRSSRKAENARSKRGASRSLSDGKFWWCVSQQGETLSVPRLVVLVDRHQRDAGLDQPAGQQQALGELARRRSGRGSLGARDRSSKARAPPRVAEHGERGPVVVAEQLGRPRRRDRRRPASSSAPQERLAGPRRAPSGSPSGRRSPATWKSGRLGSPLTRKGRWTAPIRPPVWPAIGLSWPANWVYQGRTTDGGQPVSPAAEPRDQRGERRPVLGLAWSVVGGPK